MACLGIRHGGVGGCMIRKQDVGYLDERSDRVFGSTHHNHSLSIRNLAVKLPNHRLSTIVNATVACDSARRSSSLFEGGLEGIGYAGDNDRTAFVESPRVSEKLDEWMRNSVTEIVKNIKEAPLLVQIYADGEVQTKKSLGAKDWPDVIRHKSSALEGVILVEELRDEEKTDPVKEEDGTRAFGVLIQGKLKGREHCKSSCYLLKTSSVNGAGMGHICTHYCLMKIQSFHKNAFSQFTDCWLVR